VALFQSATASDLEYQSTERHPARQRQLLVEQLSRPESMATWAGMTLNTPGPVDSGVVKFVMFWAAVWVRCGVQEYVGSLLESMTYSIHPNW